MSGLVFVSSHRRDVRAGFWYRRARLLMLASLAGLATPFVDEQIDTSAGRIFWFIDLLTHWQWAFAAGLVIAIVVMAPSNLRWMPLAAFAALPAFSASPELPNGVLSPVLSVASANIHAGTTDPHALVDWLAAAQPDVVVVVEVSDPAAGVLDGLRDYPYRILQPDSSPFGLALLSKLPIASSAVTSDEDGIPCIQAELSFAGHRIAIAAFHPMPPLSLHYQNQRDIRLRAHIATTAAGGTTPAILAGDFNATPWSSAFQGLDALGWRRATGLLPTWPAWGQGLFGIPIDHVLASSDWRVIEREVGPQLGSDHLPVLVKLALTGGDATADAVPVKALAGARAAE